MGRGGSAPRPPLRAVTPARVPPSAFPPLRLRAERRTFEARLIRPGDRYRAYADFEYAAQEHVVIITWQRPFGRSPVIVFQATLDSFRRFALRGETLTVFPAGKACHLGPREVASMHAWLADVNVT